MHSLERALVRVERALSVRLPRGLFTPDPAVAGDPVDPEALLEPTAGVVLGGWMLPDALPVARDGAGDTLLLRFDGWGVPLELVAWTPGGWQPVELGEFRSAAARALAEVRAALRTGLSTVAATLGRNALARDLGVGAEAFAAWLRDPRLVPEVTRAALRRLTGKDDAALFAQDWSRAGAQARRIAATRPELAWPGEVLGYLEEERGALRVAAGWYAAALLADAPTLFFDAGPGRPFEGAARRLAEAYSRCAGAVAPEPALAVALDGPAAVRAHHLGRCDALRSAGRHAQASEEARRAGWRRHLPVDMDDVLGRLADAADAAGARAHGALARLHLRAWVEGR
jgi:hypothetical protein